MANTYANTVLQNARAWITPELEQKFERRKELSEATELFLYDRRFTIPNLAEIREATTQTTQAMYKIRKTFTKNTAKSCTRTGETGGSSYVNLTWSQLGFAVRHETKKYHGNELKGAQGLAYDFLEGEADFWWGTSGFESILIAYLEANRTQVAQDLADGTHFDWLGNPQFFYQVPNADSSRFYNYMITDMLINNYSGLLLELHNTGWSAEIAYDGAQGPANNVNTQFQFAANVKRFRTNLLTTPSYYMTEQFIIPTGGVTFLDWNDPLNRKGSDRGTMLWTTYESRFFPGIKFDLFVRYTCADTSANGGTTQDEVIDFEFTLNYSIVKQPSTVANETPIFKYMQLSP